MRREICTTDGHARLTLPKAFANSKVIIEHLSESELRIRLAPSSDTDERSFVEESITHLSDTDRDRFLDALANPPAPTIALTRAAARYKSRRG